MRRRVIWSGRIAGLVAALCGAGLLASAFFENASSGLREGHPIEAALVLGAALAILAAARWSAPGIALAALASMGLVLKPAFVPLVSSFSGGALSYTAESHLYFVVPGVVLLGVAAAVLAVRLVPASWLGLDGESLAKDLLSAAGIGLGSLAAGSVLVLGFLVDRSSLAGVVLRFLPGIALAVLGIAASVLGVLGAFAATDREDPETSPSLAADLSGADSLLRAVAEAPARDVRAWLPTENAASGARAIETAMPTAGTRLDRFELVEPIGAGGMGRVFRARDTRLLREVALKLLPAELTHDPVRRERLLREARAAARVSHPNVLAIHEVGGDEGSVPYIVMELVSSRTLRDRLNEARLSLSEALAIAREIAAGLGAAHDQGVIHRDLKPENVAISADGRIKLLDFGLARFDDSPEPYGDTMPGSPHLTREGQVLGTPAYMSPEQALGEPVDARSDVFSFGTLLFELVTGHSPFSRHTSEETRRAVIAAALPGDAWHAHLPVGLVAVIRRATEREPGRRYGSGRELALALVDRELALAVPGELAS